MNAREDTEMNIAWVRVLVGIGVIIAFLTLGALEVLTARRPAGEGLVGQATSDNEARGPWQDFLEMRPQFGDRDLGEPSINERVETGRAVAAAQDAWLPQ